MTSAHDLHLATSFDDASNLSFASTSSHQGRRSAMTHVTLSPSLIQSGHNQLAEPASARTHRPAKSPRYTCMHMCTRCRGIHVLRMRLVCAGRPKHIHPAHRQHEGITHTAQHTLTLDCNSHLHHVCVMYIVLVTHHPLAHPPLRHTPLTLSHPPLPCKVGPTHPHSHPTPTINSIVHSHHVHSMVS